VARRRPKFNYHCDLIAELFIALRRGDVSDADEGEQKTAIAFVLIFIQEAVLYYLMRKA
jgi:hypothetical protein